MAKSKVKKSLCDIIDKHCGDVTLFGHQLDELKEEFDALSPKEMVKVKELLLRKIDKHGVQTI